MATINLLPWREQLREKRKRLFILTWGGSVAMVALLMVISYLIINLQVRSQTMVNAFLDSEVTRLKKDISTIHSIKEEKASLLARIGIIKRLQDALPLNVRLFDELPRILPSGITFTKMQRSGSQLTIVGSAESNTTISNFMRNVEESRWLRAPVLTEIKTIERPKTEDKNLFELQMQQAQLDSTHKDTA